jgi:hypothetical protein
MKMLMKSLLLSVALFGSTAALAECPVELPFQKLMDCMVTEGAGDEYPVAEVMAEINKEKGKGMQAQGGVSDTYVSPKEEQ